LTFETKEMVMWRILIVDDEPNNRKLLVEVLGAKASCEQAQDGREALEIYQASVKHDCPFDVILLDVAMPDIDGIEVLKRIRESEDGRGIPWGKGIPVIMVTAFKQPFMASFREGADDYILKPIDPDQLIKKLETKPSEVK